MPGLVALPDATARRRRCSWAEQGTAGRSCHPGTVWLGLILGVFLAGRCPPSWAGLGRRVDPAQVVPLDQLPAEYRESVAEVIRDHTFHRQGEAETFPCNAGLYLSLVNEPVLTFSLWKDLAASPVQLRKLGANRYQGEDGIGTTATWDFVLRTPRLHVLLAYLNYVSPAEQCPDRGPDRADRPHRLLS